MPYIVKKWISSREEAVIYRPYESPLFEVAKPRKTSAIMIILMYWLVFTAWPLWKTQNRIANIARNTK